MKKAFDALFTCEEEIATVETNRAVYYGWALRVKKWGAPPEEFLKKVGVVAPSFEEALPIAENFLVDGEMVWDAAGGVMFGLFPCRVNRTAKDGTEEEFDSYAAIGEGLFFIGDEYEQYAKKCKIEVLVEGRQYKCLVYNDVHILTFKGNYSF